MPRRPLACILLAAVALSCAPHRSDVGTAAHFRSPFSLLELIAQRNTEIRTLTGRGNLAFDSPEVAGSAFFRSSLKRPDSLLVQLQGPFGMDVGTFFLSGSKYVMYNAIENVVRSGNPSSTAIRSIIPFDLAAEDLVNIFGGMFPLPRDTLGLRTVEIDGDITHLAITSDDGQCDYWVDTDQLVVTRFRRMNAAGESLIEMEARDFKEFDGFTLPRQLRLTIPRATRTVSVYYTSITANGDPPSFAFTVPSGARTERH